MRERGFIKEKAVILFITAFSFVLSHLVFEAQIIRNHRNKLAVRGLSAVILDSISEVRIQRIDISSIPRDLDGVAYRSFDAACGGLVFLRNGRVENLCDRVDNITVVNGKKYCRSQILIALDVGGDSFALFFTELIALFIGVNS